MSVYIQDQIIPHPHAASCPDAAFVSSGSGSEGTVPTPQSWATPLLCLFGIIPRQSPQSIESLQPLQDPVPCIFLAETQPWAGAARVGAAEPQGRARGLWLTPLASGHQRSLRGCTTSETMALQHHWP